jgi:flagellar hook protein FlgE
LAENADFFIVSDEAADRYLLRAAGEEALRDRSGYGFLETVVEESSAASPPSITRGEAAEIAGEVLRTAAAAKASPIPRLLARAAGIPDASRPSAKSSSSAATARSAVVTYDHGGRESVLDVYLSKTMDDRYELAGFDRAEAAPGGGFPYAVGPRFVESLIYDSSTGLMALVPIADDPARDSPAASPSFFRQQQGLILLSVAVTALLIVLVVGFTR